MSDGVFLVGWLEGNDGGHSVGHILVVVVVFICFCSDGGTGGERNGNASDIIVESFHASV